MIHKSNTETEELTALAEGAQGHGHRRTCRGTMTPRTLVSTCWQIYLLFKKYDYILGSIFKNKLKGYVTSDQSRGAELLNKRDRPNQKEKKKKRQ